MPSDWISISVYFVSLEGDGMGEGVLGVALDLFHVYCFLCCFDKDFPSSRLGRRLAQANRKSGLRCSGRRQMF